MDDATTALLGLTGTLVTVKVLSDVATQVKPVRARKQKRRKLGF